MKIVFVSDTHLTPRTAAFNRNWSITRNWIETASADLVVNLGDITADGFDDVDELALARREFDGLPCEVRFVPGNHDIGDNPVAPGVPNKHPLSFDRLDQYRAVFGADRWVLDAGPWRLLGLNAQLFGTDTPEEALQFDWIGEQICGFRGPIGLMIHKPLFREGPDDTEAHIRYLPVAPRKRLLGLLETADLRFVVSGHAHQTRSIEVDGVEHIWAPSTAFVIPDAMQERIGDKVVGLLTLALEADGHHFSLERPAGLEPYSILDFPEVYAEIEAVKAKLATVP